MSSKPERRALVIGIDSYPTKPLQFAVSDAKEVDDVLRNSGAPYGVHLLLNEQASRKAILSAVRQLANSNGTLKLLYLAGHAALTEASVQFVPYDAGDWSDFVSMREIGDMLISNLDPRDSLVVIADCCHAGALELDSQLTKADLRDAMAGELDRPNVASLLACTAGAPARESASHAHGVFTYHLLRALRGDAADSGGGITSESAYHYVARQMNITSHQRPVFRARLTGYVPIVTQAPGASVTASRQAEMTADATELRELLDSLEAKLAELKPPFSTRQTYRESGWQQAAKMVSLVATKRGQLKLRWGDALNAEYSWRMLSSDIDAVVAELANLSIGMHTEYGEVVRKLGEGGFGAVFQVRDQSGGSRALKIFHGQELGNLAKLSRFRIGYRAMDQLSHPRIVRVEKFLESPLGFYMEYIEGENLRRWYGSEREPAELLRILQGIVETVEYANGLGVRHRDIKPENVLMYWDNARGRWESKLTDFDLAWFPAATSHTIEAFGAPFYAAPEQLASPGEDEAHRETVDVYGLSMLALYLINGEDPVHVAKAMESLERKLEAWPSPSAAGAFVELLREGGQADPQLRLASVSLFRRGLMRVVNFMLAVAEPYSQVPARDFFTRASRILGAECRLADDGVAHFESLSRRTRYTARWTKDYLSVQVEKLDNFMAEKSSHAGAKKSLVRRLDSLLSRTQASGYQLSRHEVPGAKTFALMEVRARGIQSTVSGASEFASLMGDIVAIYENL